MQHDTQWRQQEAEARRLVSAMRNCAQLTEPLGCLDAVLAARALRGARGRGVQARTLRALLTLLPGSLRAAKERFGYQLASFKRKSEGYLIAVGTGPSHGLAAKAGTPTVTIGTATTPAIKHCETSFIVIGPSLG